MKPSSFLLLFCLFSGSVAYAQTETGNRFIGGNLRIGADKTKTDGDNTSQSNFVETRVDAGKFLANDFAVGASLQVERKATPTGQKSRLFNPQVLGTARYYAGKERAKIFLAGQLGLSISQSSYLKFPGSDFEERIKNTQIGGAYGIGAGIAWFLRPGVAVEALMGWEGHSLPKTDSKVSFTGLKIGLMAYLDTAEKGTSTFSQKNERPETGAKPDSFSVKNPVRPIGKHAEYGGQIGLGFSIFDGIGVPLRYYISPKQVAEVGLYYGAISYKDNLDLFQIGYGPMLGTGFTFFGDRVEKKGGAKIRANGLALRLNHLTGDYSTTMLSAGWAMETFKKDRWGRSFIFELGLRGQFPNFEVQGEPLGASPTAYLRCHWNFFLK